MTSREPTANELALRLDFLNRDVGRAATKESLSREADARRDGDKKLEDAVRGIREDISAIKEGQKWAFRLVASTLFLTAVGVIVALVQKGTP